MEYNLPRLGFLPLTVDASLNKSKKKVKNMKNNSINPRRWHKENTSVTLNVENFPHWVWVWGVEENDGDGDRVPDTQYRDSYNQPYSTVHFTYTHLIGQNLFDVEHAERWPTHYYVSGKLVSIYMPWFSGFKQTDRKYISTTELIWYWHASDYNPSGSPSPSATTRYYDGTP